MYREYKEFKELRGLQGQLELRETLDRRELQVRKDQQETSAQQAHKVYRVIKGKLVQQDLTEILAQLEPLGPKELQDLREKQALRVQQALKDL